MQVWLNSDSEDNAVKISKFLNSRVKASTVETKAFIIQMDNGNGREAAESLFKASGSDLIGTCFIKYGEAGSGRYKMNTDPSMKNTILVYKRKKVTAKFVNLKADAAGLKELGAAIDSIEQ